MTLQKLLIMFWIFIMTHNSSEVPNSLPSYSLPPLSLHIPLLKMGPFNTIQTPVLDS